VAAKGVMISLTSQSAQQQVAPSPARHTCDTQSTTNEQ